MKQKRSSKPVNPAILLIMLVIAAAVTLLGQIDVKLSDTGFSAGGAAIPGLGNSVKVEYSEVLQIDYYDSFAVGRRTFGTGNVRIKSGLFKNDQLGEYDCYVWNSCTAAIVVKYQTAKGKEKYVAFNAATPEETKALYAQLGEKVDL